MVHFYDEVTTEQLYSIAYGDLDDILTILDALLSWIRSNPDKIDEVL